MDYFSKYGYVPSDERVNALLEKIPALAEVHSTPEVFKKCFSLMDLTSLHTNDTADSVRKLVEKANGLKDAFPTYPLPASVCVFPNFAHVVKETRNNPELHVTTVSACFPSSQSFLDVKVRECVLAVRDGADEVDIVLALNSFCSGDFEEASREICRLRKAVDTEAAGRKIILKVILETGLLFTAEAIANASFLAMEAGADFIKTSTGKVEVNATPRAAVIMCECIDAFYKKTGRKVGFKAAGGISSAKDALVYYCVVLSVLGREWLDRDCFRFGVSRLGNSLMEAIEQHTVKYF